MCNVGCLTSSEGGSDRKLTGPLFSDTEPYEIKSVVVCETVTVPGALFTSTGTIGDVIHVNHVEVYWVPHCSIASLSAMWAVVLAVRRSSEYSGVEADSCFDSDVTFVSVEECD